MRMLLLLLFLPLTASAKIQVVTTLPDLAAWVAEVGGPHVQVTALARAHEDPHYVDAKPSFLVPLSRADLLVVSGLDLEAGWAPKLLVSARNPKIRIGSDGYLDASSALKRRLEANPAPDRAQGDIHAGGNPHFTQDPRAAVAVVVEIAERLARIDPANAAKYKDRSLAFIQALNAFSQDARARFETLPVDRRRLVTYHRSWSYLMDWLDVKALIEVEPRPGIPPTPAHTARVVKQMRSANVKVVLQESYYPSKTTETIARLAGGSALKVQAQTNFSTGQRYLDHLRVLTDRIHVALSR